MSNKHDANVRKSTLVNFQIGLVASLLFTYLMFEVYTTDPAVYNPKIEESVPQEEFVWNQVFEVYKEPEAKPIAEKRSEPVVNPDDFKVIDDKDKIAEAEDEFKNDPPAEVSTPVNTSDIDDVPEAEEPVDFPFNVVEFVPVFPGCEKLATNEEKASCFSQKVKRIVSKKFNAGLGEELGLKGLQRIYVQFEVYKDGTIQNIQARGTHPMLEKEAKRVVSKFPKMTPGKQRDKNVTVKYQLPIVFKVVD
ncbi:energy transducer TonB [Aquimarina sp. MMG016]|uniref:energy transducer TonB n=1 Tax=Aquimarina sp. MMG016 TaxID=2822690 RepID=UPI001B3A5054|nr:energy transducer TonB [Aquimarina sp. MMG016]MBQ4818681.1 energy transducer TonB [Aquimarina sp. MMG016]